MCASIHTDETRGRRSIGIESMPAACESEASSLNRSSSIVRSSAIGYGGLFAVTLLLAWWQGRLPEMFPSPVWPATGVNLLIGGALAAGVPVGRRRVQRNLRLGASHGGRVPLRSRRSGPPRGAGPCSHEWGRRRGVLSGFDAAGLRSAPDQHRVRAPSLPRQPAADSWTVIAIVLGFALGIVYRETASLLAVALPTDRSISSNSSIWGAGTLRSGPHPSRCSGCKGAVKIPGQPKCFVEICG